MALVPTMGALHEGHLSLIQQARRHAANVVVSIFVNPTQFGPDEDYERYPRTLKSDMEQCRQENVSLVFAPDFSEMYGEDGKSREQYLSFRIKKMNAHLCGPRRPGHFEGVLQVVNKLFHIVQPDVAVFGQKDIQQWFIIRQMVNEMDIPVELVMGPTRREHDGLARSSRNAYLSMEERNAAPLLYDALHRVRRKLGETCREFDEEMRFDREEKKCDETGRKPDNAYRPDMEPDIVTVDPAIISEEVDRLGENGFIIEYFSLVSTPDLQPSDVIEPGRSYVIAAAARLGKTRLIDNVLFSHKDLFSHDA